MGNERKIGPIYNASMVGIVSNTVVLWCLAIAANANWFIYAMLATHGAVTVWQICVIFGGPPQRLLNWRD